MAKTASSFPQFARVQDTFRNLQSEGEKLLTRVRKEATKLVSQDRRKLVDSLISQAKSIRTDLQKRTEKALHQLEATAEKALSRVEAQAKKGIDPLVKRLNLPTKHDLDLIGKRVSNLEKRVEEILKSA